jgi:hypothetical protein
VTTAALHAEGLDRAAVRRVRGINSIFVMQAGRIFKNELAK